LSAAGVRGFLTVFAWGIICLSLPAAAPPQPLPGDAWLADYFREETAKLSSRCLADIKSLADWQERRAIYRRQAAEMLGLFPPPQRTDLKPVITGKFAQDNIVVEKLHFQSLPGLYVTANLYMPKEVSKPLPGVLYVCGHGPVLINGISYGNKVSYQHHGIWFARHGYACLLIDTVQLGEIQGLHHGTYRAGLWWWNARGYSPAGVEAWNSIRALDYLGTRPEVDPNRLGVTGRSGGGAYSWTLASTDERVKVIAPVAGITDLQNHVVDGTVEGHCDCMFFVNTHRWDYPLQAALAAPRPLLLVNTDSDTIFPLDGVIRTHAKVKMIYQLHKAAPNLGLVIGPGPHKDTQDLQIPVFRWFNKHLKGEDPVIETAASKLFTPAQLKVFDQLPADAINTNVHDVFVPPAAAPAPPVNREAWEPQKGVWLQALQAQCFAGWPEESGRLNVQLAFSEKKDGVIYEGYDFQSQPHVKLRFYLMRSSASGRSGAMILRVAGESRNQPGPSPDQGNTNLLETIAAFGLAATPAKDDPLFQNGVARLCLQPRGLGRDAWSGDAKKQTQIRRRFMLLGQTLDGMRVWDIRRGIQAVRTLKGMAKATLHVEAETTMGVNVVYASLAETDIQSLTLTRLPASHMTGPDYLNVLKILDIPQAVALAAERGRVVLRQPEGGASPWDYVTTAAKNLHWPPGQFTVIP
jgi:dienelactone hydrolase